MIDILVVEDEYILAINLKESLELIGYRVLDIVDSGADAIEKALQLRPNLVLMDIRLRGELDGIEAAGQIWKLAQIPVIYVTGHSDRLTVERATLTYPFGYILKPIKEQELYVAIETALYRYDHEHFLHAILQGMGDGVIVVDSQLRVQYLNHVAEALTGWTLAEAREKEVTEIFKLIDQHTQLPGENPLVTAFQQQTTVYLPNHYLLLSKDGTTIPVADSATPLKDQSGQITGAVLVFRDETQRRLAEERDRAAERARQLEFQMAELQRLHQLREDFLATTSHAIRTPLSNMKMALSLLENSLQEKKVLNPNALLIPGTVDYYLKILREQCEHELNLMDDLLNLRMIDANAYPLELTVIKLPDLLPQIISVFHTLAYNNRQTLKVKVSPNLPSITSDQNILIKILSELLNNACKYTPVNEWIVVKVQLNQNLESFSSNYEEVNNFDIDNAFLQIIISNSGIEIPTKEITRIFEPFYQIYPSNARTEKNNPWEHQGTGLGLTLVKKMVEYLQGTIDVNSSQGWTNFTVQLPLNFIDYKFTG
ncbi:two-component hybrid sensor and regulator [Richelia sinica FACHB-800]|uniref:histidine kinase n=1 Tax=Richelia sinica FACHB-800 TaxID=1357546 RepID=A0A975T862_9NOST|nr:response regulator [Richelia sinica]QXE23932.1 two-component hybrid sensor and regulator [Richelia sinica FACHB-800]